MDQKHLLILLLLLGMTGQSQIFAHPQARFFANLSSAGYTCLISLEWVLSEPVWKPDSTAVLVDKPGNVDFSAAEKGVIDSLGGTLVPDGVVQAWLHEQEWIGEDQNEE